MLQPGRKYSGGSGYRYGFNGKENDKDVSGDGNQYDYGFRIYNPRIGKFLSFDPLFKGYPWNSTYAYAENDVIRSIDLDGLEKITIHQRAFAPWDYFGDLLPAQSPYAGDNRGFSLNYQEGTKKVTARIIAITAFDIDKGVQIGATNAYCDPSIGPKNFYGKKGSTTEIPDEKTTVYHQTEPDGFFGSKRVFGKEDISINFEGHDARVQDWMAPDIDFTGSFSFDNTEKGILKVDFTLYGKPFPAYETFIEDANHKKISIFTRPAPPKTEILKLFNDPGTELDWSSMRIGLDANKNFSGTLQVKELSKNKWKAFFGIKDWNTYTIDEWNKKNTSKKAAPDKSD